MQALPIKEATKAVKKALREQGIDARVYKGTGTSFNFIHVDVIGAEWTREAYERIRGIVLVASRRASRIDDPITDLFLTNVGVNFYRKDGAWAGN